MNSTYEECMKACLACMETFETPTSKDASPKPYG